MLIFLHVIVIGTAVSAVFIPLSSASPRDVTNLKKKKIMSFTIFIIDITTRIMHAKWHILSKVLIYQ